MSQATDWGVQSAGPSSMADVSLRINPSLDAVLTGHAGSVRPTYAQAGTVWEDTSVAGTVKFWFYDGTNDRLILSLATATGAVTFNAGDGTITNAKFANMSQATVKGRASGAGTGVPGDLAAADLFAILSGLVAPRPVSTPGALGESKANNVATSTALVLPAGGTWEYIAFVVNNSTGALENPILAAGVAAGGTTIFGASATQRYASRVWKVQ